MASYTVNFALIGCDGQGKTDSGELVAGGQTMVARCDVDFGSVDREVANLVRRGLMPARPEALPDNVQLDGGGAIFIGEKGIFVHGTYAARPRVYPESLMEVAAKVPKTYFRVEKSGDSPMAEARHRMNWINAIKGKEKATCPFE
jgi:hypothetical protein